MTLLSKPVTRESAVFYRGRALVVSIHPRHLEMREKGRRDILTVDFATVYEFALKLRWKREQAEKAVHKKSASRRRARP